MAPPTKTTSIHPLTPSQTTESPPISSSSAPPRRRSLRLAAISISEPPQTPKPSARVSKSKFQKSNLTASESDSKSKPNQTDNSPVNLRSGKKPLKRGITIANENQNEDDSENNASKKNKLNDEGDSSQTKKGKETVVIDENVNNESDDESSDDDSDIENITTAVLNVIEQSRNSANNSRERGLRRNLERFRNIARENASRFALFANDEDNVDDLSLENENEQEKTGIEIEDWPGPFSTAMKIIRDREKKGIQFQAGSASKQKDLIDSIKWIPKSNVVKLDGKASVTSLQELCIRILAKNVDAIVSLESVPDALRHRLSQLLCDSRRMNDHFFALLVGGAPTEIRLRNCSWLSEEHFTKCFQATDTSNLVVLQLDLCGRCLPDYVVVATLARSPKQLPQLTSLSLRGACRLSDGGLRTLVSSTPTLGSINLSMCSLLTSASLYILAETLKSFLKELYVDHCFGIDAALIVPALVEFEHLQVLSLAGIPTVCDTFIKDYIVARGHNMKELNLKDCINLTDASMKVIAEHCPGMCRLDLSNLSKLTDLSMGYLTNGCRALHTLKLCRNSFSDEAVAAFVETNGESLKDLSLNNVKKVGYHTTISLASHAKKLHSLDVSWCRNLTDNALGLIVDSCSSLRLLKLFGCTQVTDVFLKGHSNSQIQIIGIKMTSVLQHVKVPDPHQGALNYSSVSVDLAA